MAREVLRDRKLGRCLADVEMFLTQLKLRHDQMLGTAPPLSSSWIIIRIGLCIALESTPNIDCYWEGAVPKLNE